MILQLDKPITTLKGVGEMLALKLARLGIFTVGDLIKHYPRRYDDFSQVLPIKSMRPGPVTFKARVLKVASRRAHRRPITITEAIFEDGTGTVKAIWFNQPYIKTGLHQGEEFLVSGNLEFRNHDLALQSPAFESVSAQGKDTGRIVPVYPETEGLSSKQLRGLIMPLTKHMHELPETLPPDIINANSLMPRGRALAEIHFPSTARELRGAQQRLAFEELFFLILAGQATKQELTQEVSLAVPLDVEVARNFVAAVTKQWGLSLTDAQRRSAWEILQDMQRSHPMNRLLEGDVGSGKTLVATLAAVMAMQAGYQVAFMVPTEILARQHYQKLTPLLAELGHEVSLLVSKMPAKARHEALSDIASNQTGLVIGTHALLGDKVQFNNLALVVVDEQHRFGVNQRISLKQKAGRLPHLLSMTATPIPRSLALTIYGDLDISIIDELPPGRKPIATKVVDPAKRRDIYKEIDAQIAAGRQVFVVCPLIQDSEKLEAKSVTGEVERLQQSIFAHRSIEPLHGRMSPEQKADVMDRFEAGEIDILVTTSVIEVGVDMPNASVMLIDGADRFGLAALHQLRGRVGRSQHKSYCYLITESPNPQVVSRLRALERSQDGFRLAQIDLELRGPGQIYGLRQHGVLDLKIADLGDTKLLAAVKKAVTAFLQETDALLKYPYISERVSRLKAITTLD